MRTSDRLWEAQQQPRRLISTDGAKLRIDSVVDQRMKNQNPKRWSRQGTSGLLQVNCAVFNGIDMLNFSAAISTIGHTPLQPCHTLHRALAHALGRSPAIEAQLSRPLESIAIAFQRRQG